MPDKSPLVEFLLPNIVYPGLPLLSFWIHCYIYVRGNAIKTITRTSRQVLLWSTAFRIPFFTFRGWFFSIYVRWLSKIHDLGLSLDMIIRYMQLELFVYWNFTPQYVWKDLWVLYCVKWLKVLIDLPLYCYSWVWVTWDRYITAGAGILQDIKALLQPTVGKGKALADRRGQQGCVSSPPRGSNSFRQKIFKMIG